LRMRLRRNVLVTSRNAILENGFAISGYYLLRGLPGHRTLSLLHYGYLMNVIITSLI